VSDRFQEGQVARLEGTVGVLIVWTLHIFIYAAAHLWDTDSREGYYRYLGTTATGAAVMPRK
jgi:hypothetical protein